MQSTPFVLVVEPSITLRTLIDVTLTTFYRNHPSAGWVIYAEAITALRNIYDGLLPIPDLAVICWDLPYLDGFDATRVIRSRGYPTAVALIVEQDRPLDRLKARQVGANATLARPFKVQGLAETLDSLFAPH